MLAAKPNDLSSIPGTHMTGESQLHRVVLQRPHMCCDMCTPHTTQINTLLSKVIELGSWNQAFIWEVLIGSEHCTAKERSWWCSLGIRSPWRPPIFLFSINKVGNVDQCHLKEPLVYLKLKKMNTVCIFANLSSGKPFCKTLYNRCETANTLSLQAALGMF